MITMDITTGLVFCITFACALLIIKLIFSKKYRLPPGPRPYPVIGNLLEVMKRTKDLHVFTRELSKKYGPIFKLQVGEHRLVFLTSLELIRECTVEKADVFSERPVTYVNTLTKMAAGGVIFRNGETWQRVRRFGLTNMRDFGVGKKSIEGKIGEELEHLLNEFKLRADEPFYCLPVIMCAVSNVICSICFGKRFEYNDEQFQRLLRLLNDFFRNGGKLLRDPANLWSVFSVLPVRKDTQSVLNIFNEIDDWILNMIKSRRETFDPNNINDLVDVYLENEKKTEEKISEFDAQRLIFDLFFAGSETTSTSLTWCLLFMIKHPDIQEKCHEEINRAIGKERQILLKDKSEIPYTEAILAEVQRMANIAALGLQHCNMVDATLGGYDIPRGTIIRPCQYPLHMDEKVFSNPDNFDPTRFIDSDGKFFRHEHLIPFGTGPRVCMGESLARTEMFIIFASLMQKFRFEKETPDTELNLQGIFGLTLSPEPFNIRTIIP